MARQSPGPSQGTTTTNSFHVLTLQLSGRREGGSKTETQKEREKNVRSKNPKQAQKNYFYTIQPTKVAITLQSTCTTVYK